MSKLKRGASTVSIWDAPPHVREKFKLMLRAAERKFGASPDACWLWSAKTNAQGYGEYKWYDHRDRKQRGSGAHRIALELKLGVSLAAGNVAGHICPKPPDGVHPDRRCFRPEHLEEVSQSQNMLEWVRMRREGRNE